MGTGGGPGSGAVSACEMTAFVSALNTLMTVPETVPVTVTEPAAGAGGVVVPPPSDPPPLHEPRASRSVPQATSLLNDWFHIFIGYE